MWHEDLNEDEERREIMKLIYALSASKIRFEW